MGVWLLRYVKYNARSSDPILLKGNQIFTNPVDKAKFLAGTFSNKSDLFIMQSIIARIRKDNSFYAKDTLSSVYKYPVTSLLFPDIITPLG